MVSHNFSKRRIRRVVYQRFPFQVRGVGFRDEGLGDDCGKKGQRY